MFMNGPLEDDFDLLQAIFSEITCAEMMMPGMGRCFQMSPVMLDWIGRISMMVEKTREKVGLSLYLRATFLVMGQL